MHAALRRRRPSRCAAGFRRGLLLCAVLWWPAPADGQTLGGVRPRMDAPPAHGVLTAFRTTVDIVRLAGSDADARFNWDVDVGIDVDLFDTGAVRGNLLANLETIVGSQLRDIDPNQNNYTTDVAFFFRLPRGELGAAFHHVSRHLGDRADLGSVSWNMVGVSYGDRFTAGPVRLDAGVRAMGTVESASVDYRAQFEVHAGAELPLTGRLALIAAADSVVVPVDGERFGRSTRNGGRVLGGVRLRTGVGAVDLFGGWEQQIDAGQFTRDTARWFRLGMRLAAPAW